MTDQSAVDTLRAALAAYEANPLDNRDDPDSWRALDNLLTALRAALAASVPDEGPLPAGHPDTWPGGTMHMPAALDFAALVQAYTNIEGAGEWSAAERRRIPAGWVPNRVQAIAGEYARLADKELRSEARPAVPALDVERLAQALDADWTPAWRETPVIGPNGVEFTEARWDKRALAEIVAREYAALQEQPE